MKNGHKKTRRFGPACEKWIGVRSRGSGGRSLCCIGGGSGRTFVGVVCFVTADIRGVGAGIGLNVLECAIGGANGVELFAFAAGEHRAA